MPVAVLLLVTISVTCTQVQKLFGSVTRRRHIYSMHDVMCCVLRGGGEVGSYPSQKGYRA